jgi:zona occludens toxin (predicted ATPase)
MRRNKEIMILLGLLVGMMGFVLWYVIDRRAKNRANPAPTAVQPVTPARPKP